MSDDGVTQAKSSQGKKNEVYPGVDHWREGQVPVGRVIVQFDYRTKENIETDNRPVSQYFTSDSTLKTVLNTETGQVNAMELARTLQVAPRHNKANGRYEYSQHVTAYKVLKPLPVAVAPIENNIVHGWGGGDQYRVTQSQEQLVEQGYLKRTAIYPTEQRYHHSPVYREIESDGIKIVHVPDVIHQRHHEMKDALWRRDAPGDQQRVTQMDRLENEAAAIRKEPAPNQARPQPEKPSPESIDPPRSKPSR